MIPDAYFLVIPSREEEIYTRLAIQEATSGWGDHIF